MKKLFIALFAFAAVFAVAGSANAALKVGEGLIDSDSDIYDATNSYTVSAIHKDNGQIDVVVNSALVTSFEGVVADADELIGIAQRDGTNYVWIAYVKTNTIYLAYHNFVATVEPPAPVNLGTYNGSYAMSSGVDHNGYPVLVSGDHTAADSFWLKLHYYSGSAWASKNKISAAAGGSPKDVVLTGTDDATTTAHIAARDNATGDLIAASEQYLAMVPSAYSATIENLAVAPYAVVATGVTDDHVAVAYQKNDAAVIVADWNATLTQYDASTASLDRSLAGGAEFDAQLYSADLTKTDIVYADGDSQDFAVNRIENSNGSLNATYTVADASITNLQSADIDYNSANQAVITYLDSAASIDDSFYQSTNFASPTLLYQQQDNGGGAIPELPGNTLWKVLLALLSLGLVVGIATFLKKKKK